MTEGLTNATDRKTNRQVAYKTRVILTYVNKDTIAVHLSKIYLMNTVSLEFSSDSIQDPHLGTQCLDLD